MSQAQIGNLQVALGINTAQFAAGLAQAQGSLATFGKGLKAFAAAAGATLSLTAVTMAVKSTVDRMDDLGKAAQKIGIPVEELSKLEYAAKLADVPLEKLTSTLAKFSKSIAEVAAGGENDAGTALAAIGVSATDANGKLRPTSQIIADIAEEFSVMRDGAGKTAIAIALFGKSGAEMVPLLNGGREAIASASAELERFGGVVTPEAAAAAEKFNDNITRLQTAMQGLLQQAVTPLLQPMTDVTQAILDFTANIPGAADGILTFNDALKDAAAIALNAYSAFWAIGELARTGMLNIIDPQGFEVGMQRYEAALERIRLQAENTETAIAKLYKSGFLASPGDAQALVDSAAGGAIKKDAPTLPPKTSGVPKIAKPAKPGTADDIYGRGMAASLNETKKSFDELWSEMESGIPTTNLVAESFQNIADTIANTLGYALEGLISGTMSVKDAFKSMAQSISQQLSQLAAELIKSSIFKLLSIAAGGIGGGVTVGGMSFGGFYANGGHLGSGQWGIAGENGPEIIRGPANIVPMDQMSSASPQMNVTVINNSQASVNTRQNQNGSLEVIIEDMIADKLTRGGNKIDTALARGYGLRRAGR